MTQTFEINNTMTNIVYILFVLRNQVKFILYSVCTITTKTHSNHISMEWNMRCSISQRCISNVRIKMMYTVVYLFVGKAGNKINFMHR